MNQELKPIVTARCYSTVFRGQPWEEAFKDDNGTFYPPGTIDWLQRGLIRAYPLKDTAQYIVKELANPNSIYVEQNDPANPNRVIGFGWGYSLNNSDALVRIKWPTATQEEARSLKNCIQAYCGNNPIWYLSEVGVLPQFQGQGRGLLLVNQLINAAPIEMPIIMRTNADSPMVRIAGKTKFNQIVGPVANRKDPLNPQRVLFYLPQRSQS
jgi:ribosomal protein S18 acetylase RimI-like enzyme